MNEDLYCRHGRVVFSTQTCSECLREDIHMWKTYHHQAKEVRDRMTEYKQRVDEMKTNPQVMLWRS